LANANGLGQDEPFPCPMLNWARTMIGLPPLPPPVTQRRTR
jgi:hypothetical protein